MANASYMSKRRKYSRPQAVLFSNYPGTIDECFNMLPEGEEFGSDAIAVGNDGYYPGYNIPAGPDFLVCSDDNRSSLDLSYERIETRERMINGRMRSVYVDDKMTLSLSWDMLPSRAFDGPFYSWGIDSSGKRNGTIATIPLEVSCNCGSCFRDESGDLRDEIKHLYSHKVAYTTDGGAGGTDLLRWYKEHPGPFWVYLAYDNVDHFNTPNVDTALNFPWDKCNYKKYSHRMEMYFADFDYDVQKRGNYDFWNVQLSLEEV